MTDGAADVALSPLCSKYPNAAADASAIEGPRRLYELIALRALVAAMESCEVGTHFQDLEDPPPSLITCYGKQLASSAVADCIVAGEHIDYSKERDENFERCVPDAGAPGNSVFLGFRNPAASGYSVADVDFLLEATRKAALSTGMAPADAQRLKTLLVAQRAKVAGDAGDAGLTASTCP